MTADQDQTPDTVGSLHALAASLDWQTLPAEVRAKMEELLGAAMRYEELTSHTIRLVPTEGQISPAARMLLATVAAGRYLHAPAENAAKAIRYPDIGELQTVQSVCCWALRKVLKAEHVNVDCLSGLQVMQMALLAYAEPGELILSISPEDGGHELTSKIAQMLGRRIEFLPFYREGHVVDVSSLDPSLKPALIYLDHSNILRPHNLAAIKAAYPGAVMVFDISHVFASVAAGVFPHPLENGADVVVGSTHKCLNGPQKAVAATNRVDLAERFASITGTFISNNHPGDVAALAMTLLEFLAWGTQYAEQMVDNANALAAALESEGVPVYDLRIVRNTDRYTYSPHVWVDCEKCGWDAEKAVQALYRECGIVVNTLYLAGGGKDGQGAKGLRLGTTEVTRLGMKEEQMRQIAKLIASSLLDRAKPAAVRDMVTKLRSAFGSVQFCVTT